MTTEPLTIGDLAARAAVTPDTLRHYERLGLVPPPPRMQSGDRVYDPATVERVGFIRKAQALGLSLEDVREVLRIADAGTPPCEHGRSALARRVRDVEPRIAELIESQELFRPDANRAATRRRPRPGRTRTHHKEES